MEDRRAICSVVSRNNDTIKQLVFAAKCDENDAEHCVHIFLSNTENLEGNVKVHRWNIPLSDPTVIGNRMGLSKAAYFSPARCQGHAPC